MFIQEQWGSFGVQLIELFVFFYSFEGCCGAERDVSGSCTAARERHAPYADTEVPGRGEP